MDQMTASGNRTHMRSTVTASSNTTHVNSRHLPDAYDNARVFGITHYNGIQPQHNLEMGVATTGNIYYSGMNPSSSTGFPLPHRASDQLPGPSTFAISGISADNFERIAGFMENALLSTSSSITPPNVTMDTVPFPFRVPSLIGVGPHGSVWNRSGEPIMVHDHNHLIHRNYLGQYFHPAGPPWNQPIPMPYIQGADVNTRWNQSIPMPYIQVPNINGSSIENGNMGLQWYHDTTGNRNVLRFPPPPPLLNQQHHSQFPMPGIRGHNINFHPPVTAASFRVPPNPPQTGFEAGPSHIVPAPPTSFPIYRPHMFMPETAFGHGSLPPFGFQVHEVALIYEVVYLIDHHRDMRLDIENMSYEDLLALGERIGSVNTGLSEETIATLLKTKVYSTKVSALKLEEAAASDDQETDSCIICQDEFKDQEKIGVLRCEHEYHIECLTKWLLEKNVCPICKSEALSPGRRDG